MPQHKWHKEIKAWADGAVVQAQTLSHPEWRDVGEDPSWDTYLGKFRIKPTPRTWWFTEHTNGVLVRQNDESMCDHYISSSPNIWVKKHKYTEEV